MDSFFLKLIIKSAAKNISPFQFWIIYSFSLHNHTSPHITFCLYFNSVTTSLK